MNDPIPLQDRPLRIRITIPSLPDGVVPGMPGNGASWNGCEFVLNPPSDDPCDFWIVMGFARDMETAWVAPENTLFINGEPLAKKQYPRAFYRQFHHVVDTHNHSRHPRLEIHAPCLGNGFHQPYDELPTMPRPDKQNKVGVICSSTTRTRGQKQRVRFLLRLKEAMGGQLVHFGRGFTPVEHRLDAILPYRFQLVMENSRSPHYWTEKLASAYVGWGFPIYHGCPNVGDYFPPESLCAINISDFDGSLTTIRRMLESPESESEIEAVGKARELLFDKYDRFKRYARLARRHYVDAPKELVTIRHYKAFRWQDRLGRPFGIGRAVDP